MAVKKTTVRTSAAFSKKPVAKKGPLKKDLTKANGKLSRATPKVARSKTKPNSILSRTRNAATKKMIGKKAGAQSRAPFGRTTEDGLKRGRGRPPKATTDRNLKKRGRPKAAQPPKKRGRPSKIDLLLKSYRRGRPPKSQNGTQVNENGQ